MAAAIRRTLLSIALDPSAKEQEVIWSRFKDPFIDVNHSAHNDHVAGLRHLIDRSDSTRPIISLVTIGSDV